MYNIPVKYKNIKNNIYRVIFVSLFILMPVATFAQNNASQSPDDCVTSGILCNPIDADSVQVFLRTLLVGAIKIGIPVIALAIIYSGFLFVSARGNEAKLKTAKDALMYTCIGAAILLGAWALAQIINETVLAL